MSSVFPEHAVLRHALVVRASDHGVDQCVCDADESAAASQLLRPAASLCCTSGPLAASGARILQQHAAAHVSDPYRTVLLQYEVHDTMLLRYLKRKDKLRIGKKLQFCTF